ncbi:MAG: hypothetical protein EXR84_06305 [Gammaproteobacteria bacterium]|nr:hypothetical protein [Gammaproteobacteria bacterium]
MKTFQLLIAIVSGAIALTSVSTAAQGPSIGNGQKNWIITEGVTRDGGRLTFKEVQIEGDGWLVIHPFEEGAPNGDKYVAA